MRIVTDMERSRTLKNKGARGRDGLSRTKDADNLTQGKSIFWIYGF